MNKQEVYDFLTSRGIEYEVTEHGAVFNMEEMSHVELPRAEADAKNLFVSDDKQRNSYPITVRADTRADLTQPREPHGTRPLSFASENDLMSLLGLIPGAVTPLGILNDSEKKVKFFLDEELVNGGLIGVHPNDNTATVWLKTTELIDIITEHGNEVEAVRI